MSNEATTEGWSEATAKVLTAFLLSHPSAPCQTLFAIRSAHQRISAPLTPAASKSTNTFTPTPARNKLPPKTPSSRMVMAAKLKEKRRGLGSSAKVRT